MTESSIIALGDNAHFNKAVLEEFLKTNQELLSTYTHEGAFSPGNAVTIQAIAELNR